MAITEGSIDLNAILVGDWSELSVEFPAESGTWLFIGSTKNGMLSVTQEIYDHISSAFPRKVDLRVPTRADMKFNADIEEIHAQNVRLILGQAPDDDNSYVYVGALSVPQYFKFRAKRVRLSDQVEITVVFWKAVSAGLLELAGGDEAVASPIEIAALDDSAGDYGGSSTAPLGYINISPKTV